MLSVHGSSLSAHELPVHESHRVNGGRLDQADRRVRNSPSLAVALNCGMGSSFSNALVNAFDKLHIVRDETPGTPARSTAGALRAGDFTTPRVRHRQKPHT
jgi:hypothetical protein